jgi:hypothetical protein
VLEAEATLTAQEVIAVESVQLFAEEAVEEARVEVQRRRALAEEDQMALVEQQQPLLGQLTELTPSMETSAGLV